jgi:hypothetical protein
MEVLFQINKVILDADSQVLSESQVGTNSTFYERKSTFKTISDGSGFQLLFSKEKYAQMGIADITAVKLQATQSIYVKTEEDDDSGILCKYMLFTGSIDNLWAKNDSGEDVDVTIYIWGE